MSRVCSKIMMSLIAFFVIGISGANAELKCVAQPSCEILGYSTENVSGCASYIHCPFDKAYKKCVLIDHTEGKCTGYSLASCPPHAKCEPCGSYKITTCRDGYKIDGDACVCATTCSDRLTQKDIPLNAGPIKQSCDACGNVTDVITGWKCNSGYVEVNGACEKSYNGCEDAGFVSAKPANATCTSQVVYQSDGSALQCFSDCACNSGFINIDGSCEKLIDCSGYPLTKCPDNAKCSECTDNYNNTTYKFDGCADGYKEQSGICVCEKVCSDTFTGTIPANATATKESCQACGVTTEIVTGFTCNDGFVQKGSVCEALIDCSEYPLEKCPDNAKCGKCTDNDGKTTYKFDGCQTEYVESDGQCVCEKVCSDTFTGTVPANATVTTETCTACGINTTIKTGYTCNNGYEDKDGACVCSMVCKDTFTGTIPANGTAITEQCTACGQTTSIVTGFTCNDGYNKSGNECVCAKVCEDTFTGNIPANAKAVTEHCTACGETSEIITGFTCNEGYDKNGNVCVCAKVCEDTYKGTIPAHAVATKETCVACSVSTEITTGWTCEGSYTKQNDSCVCATTCTDKVTSKPENSEYITEKCTACDVETTIKTGWTCNSGYNKSGDACVCAKACVDTVTSKPENSEYITEKCTACDVETTIKTGWTCNSGYTKSGDACVCAKTCTDTVTSKPENSEYITETCTACDVSTTIKTGWTCNSGYNKSGDSCVCAKTCADTVTSKPANSEYITEKCTACDVETTIKTGWTCNSGYNKSGDACVCAKTCADTVTSKPANSSYVTETCTACDVSTTIKTGWECNSGYNKSGDACVCAKTCTDTYTGALPENAYYTTAECTACDVSTTIKTGWECNSGYSKQGNACVCATTCTDKVSGKPDNSSYVTETCNACGVETTIKTGWTCNSEYTKSGDVCVCATTCTDTYTGTLPANAYYTTGECTACNIGKTIKTGWECNSGYNKSGNACVCATTCTDKVTSKPANSSYVTETCTACDVSTTINSSWTCNSGYNKSGDTCVCATTCTDEYTGTIPANATATQKSCTACGVTSSITTGWTCNSGYMRKGDACEKIIDCSSHTLISCPSNANCSKCTDNSGNTTYRFESCQADYTLSGGVCVCAKTCTDKVTSKPANSSYVTEICTACDVSTTINSSWTCNSGYNKSGDTCVCAKTCADTYTGTLPANAYYTTAECTACDVSTTIKTGWECNSGYSKQGNACVCATACTDKVTTKPANSSYVTETCTACDVSTTIKTGWECDSEYTKSGDTCVCSKTCKDTYTGTLPANAYYTTEECTACNIGKTIKTGWECNSGYNKQGNACVCATTCTDKVTSKPANSSYVTETCTACDVSKTINSSWTCNSGYNKSGDTCVCAKTCTDKVTSKPANSSYVTETCTACDVSTTIKTGWECNSGYTESGNACVCATACTDKVTTKPANSEYITETCTACDVSTTIKTGWTCNGGYNKSGDACVCAKTCADTVTSKPDNSSYVTERCTACDVSTTIRTGWTCNNGYTESGNACVCAKTCKDTYTGVIPANATAVTEKCDACGDISYITINWTCNSGYNKSGDACVCAKTCADTVTSKPANSSYVTETCTACSVSSTIKTGWTCNNGYTESGGACVCAKTCADTVTSKPANSEYITETCTACDVSTTIKTGWTCNSGYNKSGDSCVCAKTCADTYTGTLPANAHYVTETCTACDVSKTIKTGWECDSGYHKSGNVCVCDTTCNNTFTGTKPTNADYTYDTCTACGKSTQIITGYTCKEGYGGDDCHCLTTCIDKISTKPTHADFVTSDCNACGSITKIKTGYTCHSGYVNSGSDCVCAKTCADTVTSKPEHSSYVTETCTACDVSTTIKTGWKCDSEYTEQSGVCVCAKTCRSISGGGPSNSHPITEECTACGVTKTITTGWECDSGYHNTGSSCACDTTCKDTYTGTLPANASYVTEECTACSVKSTIKTGWKCNSGYVQIGNSCQRYYASCSAAGYLASPKANATCKTTSIYLASGASTTCYYGCTCNSGYSGDPCVCSTTCKDKISTKPENSEYVTETCTACGVDTTIKTDWKCSNGYVKSGNSCVCPEGTYATKAACESANPYSNCSVDVKCYKPTSCKSGYGKTTTACGSRYLGWELGTSDAFGCRQCNKKTCPAVLVAYPTYGKSSTSGSGSAGYIYKTSLSTTDSNVANCGTQGAKGWTTAITGSYSGDSACYVCKPNTCPVGYSTGRTSVADCGSGGSAKWNFTISSSVTSGDELCSNCTYKGSSTTCPTGYTAGLTSVSKCGTTGYKGWTLKTSGSCGQCEAKECKAGISKNTSRITVTEFIPYSKNMSFRMYTSGGGWQYLNFTSNGYYTGDAECGSFALDLTIFCDDYRREIKKCADGEYASGIYTTDECMDNANDRWAKAYDDVDMCQLCTGVFGSVSDLFFCDQESLSPGIDWGEH